MSADEFWKDDPQLFVSYRTSFINKKQRELEELDYKCWLQGLYIHDGNGKLFSSLKQMLTNLFSKSKDRKKIDTYPKKPYREQAKEKKMEKAKKTNYENFEKNLSYIGSMKQRYLDNLKNKSAKGR
jgi:hypothetical protein